MARYRIFGGVLLVGFLAAGCGGADTDAEATADIATLESDTTISEQAAAAEPESVPAGAADDDAPTETLTREDAQLEFSKCMRENGFDEFPDIAGGNMREALQASDLDFRDPEFREVMQTCREVMADAGFARAERTPEEQAAAQEQQLEVAACLRKSYPEFPDPDFDGATGGGGRRGFGPEALADAGIDPRSPEFREAIDACRAELGIEDNRGRQQGRPAGTIATDS